jgi:serine/threonine-protein kinase
MAPLEIGRTLAQYRIECVLGTGGMGVVYQARDTRLQRRVALKVLAPDRLDDRSRERLRAEALMLSSVSHTNVATVFDFGCERGIDYLVMECVPGKTLDELLRDAPFATDRVVALGAQLAQGLAAAHASSVVHRDIKPGNLRVTPEGLLKILDFGVATSPTAPDSTDTTETGVRCLRALAGTMRYMAPERLRGAAADARSDVFAAGVVLYEMACGRPPFDDAQPIRLIESILNGRCPRPSKVNPQVERGLEVVILRALSCDPAARYRNAMELAAALEPLAAGGTRRAVIAHPMTVVRQCMSRLAGALACARPLFGP